MSDLIDAMPCGDGLVGYLIYDGATDWNVFLCGMGSSRLYMYTADLDLGIPTLKEADYFCGEINVECFQQYMYLSA